MGLSTASTFLKVGVLMSFLAAVCHVIGFATPSWRKAGLSEQGLWRGCTGNLCFRIDGGDKFRAVQAMETIGLICLGAVLVAALLFLFIDSMRRKTIRTFLIAGSFLGVAAIIIGVIIYGVDFIGGFYEGSYSFGLSIVGAILAFVAAIFYILDRPR